MIDILSKSDRAILTMSEEFDAHAECIMRIQQVNYSDRDERKAFDIEGLLIDCSFSETAP